MEAIAKKTEKYERIKLLEEDSQESYNTSYIAKSTNNGEYAVIKNIDLDSVPSTDEKDRILNESKLLARKPHKYIIRFNDAYKTKTNQL